MDIILHIILKLICYGDYFYDKESLEKFFLQIQSSRQFPEKLYLLPLGWKSACPQIYL